MHVYPLCLCVCTNMVTDIIAFFMNAHVCILCCDSVTNIILANLLASLTKSLCTTKLLLIIHLCYYPGCCVTGG